MIFVWGTKERRKNTGFVAEICRSCSAIRPHRLVEVRAVPHVYWVPMGPGKVAGYQVACGECQSVQEVHPSRYRSRVKQEVPLDQLVAQTRPDAHAELEEDKARDERARSGKLLPEERVQVMMEVLYPVTEAVEARAASGRIDARTGLLALATLTLPWALILPGTAAQSQAGEAMIWIGVGVALAGVAATVHASRSNVARFIRRTQGEPIRTALRDFHPSPSEIAEIASGLRTAGTALGRKLDVQWCTELFYSPSALSGGRG